jgi:cell wall assembly regulator SMI1
LLSVPGAMMRRMTAASVTESWARIERWLARHAPDTYARLAPPASPSAVAEAEETLGLPFPEPLLESLLRHDGTEQCTVLPPFWGLLGTQKIADEWAMMVEIDVEYGGGRAGTEQETTAPEDFSGDASDDASEDPYGSGGSGDILHTGLWWHRRWVPFADNGCGDFLILDQRPGFLHGRVGETDHEGDCTFGRDPMWSTLPALFEATARGLETGGVLDGTYERVVKDGALAWRFL